MRSTESMIKKSGSIASALEETPGKLAAEELAEVRSKTTKLIHAEEEMKSSLAAAKQGRLTLAEKIAQISDANHAVVTIVTIDNPKLAASLPKEATFEVADPMTYNVELAAVLNGAGKAGEFLGATLDKARTDTRSARDRSVELDKKAAEAESAHGTAQLELLTELARAELIVHLAVPKDAPARRHLKRVTKKKVAEKKDPGTPSKEVAVAPEKKTEVTTLVAA